jgi:hypothetical protein
MSDIPMNEKKGNRRIIVLILAIVLVLLCGCLAAAGLGWTAYTRSARSGPRSPFAWLPATTQQVEATRQVEREMTVDTPVELEIKNGVGPIRVIATDEDQVRVSARVRAWGSSQAEAQKRVEQDVTVEIRQRERGSIQIEGYFTPGPYTRSPSVEFTVFVPRSAKLIISNDVGAVEVRGVNGALNIKVSVGEVNVRDWTMTGDSVVSSNVGQVTVGLPSASAFNLSATANVGSIDCEFDVTGERGTRRIPGDQLSGGVGSNPQMQLRLSTATGDIRINKER